MATARLCHAGPVAIGAGRPLCVIAGPCVIESREMGLAIGRAMRDACRGAGLSYIFKASFDKANRSSGRSPRGPGLQQGLEWIASIASELGVPCTTDIHDPAQAVPAAQKVDILQIPAFLCRQTDLLLAAGAAAARHQRAVNVKKGQFLSPGEMNGPVRKLAESGCTNVLLTERGTFFGYGRLVNDFLGVGEMMALAVPGGAPPVCFDCTHSTQQPGAGEQTGGRPQYAPMLACAAVAAGVHAVFMECHPEPAKALSDASTMLTVDAAAALVGRLAKVRAAIE